MILDSSAVLPILWGEPDSDRLIAAIEADADRRMSVASFVESGMVAQARHGDAGERELGVLLQRLAVELVPVSEEQGEIAKSTFRLYGEGRHPAALNYGDCFSYALALISNQPLIFTGHDFSQTDIRVA